MASDAPEGSKTNRNEPDLSSLSDDELRQAAIEHQRANDERERAEAPETAPSSPSVDDLSHAVDGLLTELERPELQSKLTQALRERLDAEIRRVLRAQVAYERGRR